MRIRLIHTVRRLALVAGSAPVIVLAACGDSDSPSGPSAPITGSYAMATVRGFSVPHTFTDAVGQKLTIHGGSVTLNPDGTFALNRQGKLNNLSFNLTEEGDYTQSGGLVTFTPDDGDPSFTGKLLGKTIAVDDYPIAGAKFDLTFKAN